MPVHEGHQASVELAWLLLRGDEIPADECQAKREELLEYCELDTLAMVRLLDRLQELAKERSA